MKALLILGAVTGACFILLLDTSIISTAIPRITNQFHSLPDIGWYGSAYLLANCALQPMTGKIYSKFSAKWVFMLFLGIFELGSLLCGVATSSKMLIVGRAVAGMGGSGITNGALTIIALCAPMEKRPVYIGIMMGISQLGIMIGPLIGGAVTQYATWRWCFYINLPAGAIVAGFLFFIHIPRPKHQVPITLGIRNLFDGLDFIGFLLFAPAAIMFLLALEWGGNAYRWNSATVIGLFCGAAGAFAIFLSWEYRIGDTAMIPFSMMKKKITFSSCITMFFLAANLITTSYYMAIYFQAVRGVSPLLAGVYILPSILSQMFVAITAGILVGRLGYYLPWVIGGTALTAIGSGLMSTFTPTSSTGIWIGFQIISGFGRGSGLQMPVLAMQNSVKPAEVPVAMSLIIFFQNIGASLFLSFAQTTFSSGLVHALPIFAPDVNVQAVINAGASGFRNVVTQALLPGVLHAYSQAISHVFYLTTGAVLVAFIACWGMGWKSIKKPKVMQPEA
ncbi:hypothetical protein OIDMADRAFT_203035 [Oidiodendron maius Zn]|uniref:Major facilitator superfamily (MFS) profile domain-containing protein n=1 Tax=Oidiodendron maius (strain Zn) TaxID=913774 RepID=A0A0C3H5V1_OIDMZ|nr:hypothetical protein OIDMADRAFT_203035 [Oidiodendron maius Zn]